MNGLNGLRDDCRYAIIAQGTTVSLQGRWPPTRIHKRGGGADEF